MKRQTFFLYLLLLTVGTGISSCVKDPDFPPTPRIEWQRFENVSVLTDPSQGPYQNMVAVVRFQDGDGNLGLSGDQKAFPQDYEGPFAPTQKHYNNICVFPERKVNGVYQPIMISPTIRFIYHGRFPRVATEERQEPLEGDIKYTIKIYKRTAGSVIKNGDVLRFNIMIVDRDLQESNTITTDEVVVNY